MPTKEIKVNLNDFLKDVKQILSPLKEQLLDLDKRLRTLESKPLQTKQPQFVGKIDFRNPELQTSAEKQQQCWEELANIMRKWGLSNVNCEIKW